jgi:hypothetical protein
MARLKRHPPDDPRRGFYLVADGRRLHTTPRADRLFRVSRHYEVDGRVPTLVVRTLVHLGEAKAPGMTPKGTVLDRFPRLNPGRCPLPEVARSELRTFVGRRLRDAGLPPAELAALNEFLREQTPLDPFEGADYLR